MAFYSANLAKLCRFNSASASDLLNTYDAITTKEIKEHEEHKSSQTIAPSAFRCARKCWFRLRGVQPDEVVKADNTMDFMARIGTACHRIVQDRLRTALSDNWLDVSEHLKQVDFQYEYNTSIDEESGETRVEILDPPIRFAVDGVIHLDETYLLEIKSTDLATFKELVDPREKDIDQVKMYASLLKIRKALIFYIDRTYGDTKCYEMTIPEYVWEETFDKIHHIQDMVEKNLAPERLPKGDIWCSSCNYHKSCNHWG